MSSHVGCKFKKLDDSEFNAFLRKGGVKLYFADEAKILQDYWISLPAKLNRQSLIQFFLKTEKTVPGEHIIESDVQLNMRAKQWASTKIKNAN